MKSTQKVNTGSGQLWWAISLLGIAVILPTVCLLWFMTQAVKNERLAVRQKLIDVYQEKLNKASQETSDNWAGQFELLNELIAEKTDRQICAELLDSAHPVVVYNRNGNRIYPLVSADFSKPGLGEKFVQAWRLEFVSTNLIEAIKLYEENARSVNLYVRLSALLGKARCLAKMGKPQQAAEIYREVAFSERIEDCDVQTLSLVANARLFLAELQRADSTKDPLSFSYDEPELDVIEIITKQNQAGAVLPLDKRLFLAHRVIKDANKPLPPQQSEAVKPVLKLLSNAELLLGMVQRFPTTAGIEDWPTDQPQKLTVKGQVVYTAKHKVGNKTALFVCSEEGPGGHGFAGCGWYYERVLKRTGVSYRIVDNLGQYAAGLEKPSGKSFFRSPIGKYFPDWQVELYFEDGDVFENIAGKQTALYIWTGILVIILILAAGGIACRAINKQMKLNKLKNDFIATVSHELKTPLSSMRVLVDTLLDGSYEEEKTATEYLELVSKENKRLSRLIDNFLTFSRMERNKQAFNMVRTDPAEIAEAAAEAIQTKFNGGKCKFDVSIDENLPQVPADKDAMVTVLVNLLDNAYKYSYDDKQIKLKVFAEEDKVCFSVKDNGVGMPRRVVKKIFNRFYQVDSSLSRQAEGTGLGLAIVKFIVDAHKGQIAVESKPGEGSEFTVKLPAGN